MQISPKLPYRTRKQKKNNNIREIWEGGKNPKTFRFFADRKERKKSYLYLFVIVFIDQNSGKKRDGETSEWRDKERQRDRKQSQRQRTKKRSNKYGEIYPRKVYFIREGHMNCPWVYGGRTLTGQTYINQNGRQIWRDIGR